MSSMQKQAEYIVGIGASAGGLEALQEFFKAVPLKTGIGYVVIQHLSPDYKSLMDELLARHTKLPIKKAVDGMLVEPDTIYLIPPRKIFQYFMVSYCLRTRDRAVVSFCLLTSSSVHWQMT